MRFLFVSVGKIREPYLKTGINDFLARLRPYVSTDLVEGLEQKTPPSPTPSQVAEVLDKEGQRILAHIKEDDFLVVLDSQGQSMTSEQLAKKLQITMDQGHSRIAFVIGGSHGLSPQVKKRGNMTLSFSPLTFPHQLAVLMLLEQVYRSFRIIKGQPYHK